MRTPFKLAAATLVLVLAACPVPNDDSIGILLSAPDAIYTTAESSTSILVDWVPVDGAEGYNIYRSDEHDGSFIRLNNLPLEATSYLDDGLVPNTVYWYRVAAVRGDEEQEISAVFSGISRLSIPGNVTVTASAPNELEISWDPVDGAESYNLYRSDFISWNFASLNLLDFGDLVYRDSGLYTNAPYWYKVAAVRDGDEQEMSNPVEGVTMLGAPANTSVTYLTASSLQISWDSLPDAEGYNVYRCDTSDGEYARVNLIPVSGPVFTDSGLAPLSLYWYRIACLRSGQEQIRSEKTRGFTAQAWAKSYGGTGDDEIKALWPTSDGGFLLAGRSNSFTTYNATWLVRIDSHGKIVWQRMYTGVTARSARETPDGGFIVAAQVMGSYRRYDFRVLKLTSSGTVTWARSLTGPVHQDYIATHIEQIPDGSYFFAGLAQGTILARLRSDGDIMWSKKFGSYLDETPAVSRTSDGGFVAVGTTMNYGSGRWDCWIVKLDPVGDILWQRAYGSSGSDAGKSVAPTSDGGFVVSGCLSNDTGQATWVAKFDFEGVLEWQKAYTGSAGWDTRPIRQTSDGGYLLACTTQSGGLGGEDIWLAKLNQAGDIDWQFVYGGPRNDNPTSIYETPEGGYVVAGNTESFPDRDANVWVIRLPASGLPESAGIVGTATAGVKAVTAVEVDTTAASSSAGLTDLSVTTSSDITDAVVLTQFP